MIAANYERPTPYQNWYYFHQYVFPTTVEDLKTPKAVAIIPASNEDSPAEDNKSKYPYFFVYFLVRNASFVVHLNVSIHHRLLFN